MQCRHTGAESVLGFLFWRRAARPGGAEDAWIVGALVSVALISAR